MNVQLLRYYRSTRWRHHPARAEVLARAGNRCQGCNTTEQLELHHRYYPRELGTETADALTVLCRHCHRAITSRIRRDRYRRRVLTAADTPRQRPLGCRAVWHSARQRQSPVPLDIRRQAPGIETSGRKETLHVSRPELHDSRRLTPPHA